jgi:hypothetical protein
MQHSSPTQLQLYATGVLLLSVGAARPDHQRDNTSHKKSCVPLWVLEADDHIDSVTHWGTRDACVQVAAKLLKRSDEIALGDFRTEIAILRKIHHPNTTQFLGACTKQKVVGGVCEDWQNS